MTRFEERGAELQGECTTIDEAVRSMNYSCRLCTTRGINIKCDQCCIATAHEQVCTILLDAEEAKYDNAMDRLAKNRRVFGAGSNRRHTHTQGKYKTSVWRCD